MQNTVFKDLARGVDMPPKVLMLLSEVPPTVSCRRQCSKMVGGTGLE